MKTVKMLSLVLALAFTMSSCFTLEHTVGSGAEGSSTSTSRQWYALWGLVELNDVDSKAMAGGAENYTIKSQRTFVDGLIGIFTGIVTIYPQSVKVTK